MEGGQHRGDERATDDGGPEECARAGARVLFMDYLTCLGYNPPKASIRIIASSSSRLRGCCRPILPFQRGKGWGERESRRLRHRHTSLTTHLSVATRVACRYLTHAPVFPPLSARRAFRFDTTRGGLCRASRKEKPSRKITDIGCGRAVGRPTE